KKRAQHGLADIQGVKDAPQAAVAKLNAHDAADDRLVVAHQLRRGRLVPSPHAPDQVAERCVLRRHAGVSWNTSRFANDAYELLYAPGAGTKTQDLSLFFCRRVRFAAPRR